MDVVYKSRNYQITISKYFDALRFAFVAKGNDYINSLIKNASKDEINKDYKVGK